MTDKPRPLDLDVEKEKLKRELMKEEIEKIKENFKGEELTQAFEWLMSESTIAYIVDVSFERTKHLIKSACEFFLRYMDNPDLLIDEHSEYEEIIRNLEPVREHGIVIRDFYEVYNEWLFRLAFRDVFENETGGGV